MMVIAVRYRSGDPWILIFLIVQVILEIIDPQKAVKTTYGLNKLILCPVMLYALSAYVTCKTILKK